MHGNPRYFFHLQRKNNRLKLVPMRASASVIFITMSLAKQLFHTLSIKYVSVAVISDIWGESSLLQEQTHTRGNVSSLKRPENMSKNSGCRWLWTALLVMGTVWSLNNNLPMISISFSQKYVLEPKKGEKPIHYLIQISIRIIDFFLLCVCEMWCVCIWFARTCMLNLAQGL